MKFNEIDKNFLNNLSKQFGLASDDKGGTSEDNIASISKINNCFHANNGHNEIIFFNDVTFWNTVERVENKVGFKLFK